MADLLFLEESAPVPIDAPFKRADARAAGVDDRQLRKWVADGLLVNPLRGVYYASQLTDDVDLRVQCVRLLAPADAVVTDRTAGWVHGAPMILAPGEHLETPPVSVFLSPGNRLRNDWASSGERMLSDHDVVEVGGIPVTSPLRTACDLGRLLHRDRAMAAIDSLLRLQAFSVDELCTEVERFKGYRRVTQLRALAPLGDARSQSPGESILRLRWLDCPGLPPPTPQLEVEGPHGSYFIDLGVEELRYGAEYDGLEWHGPEQQAADSERRTWLRDEGGYLIDVLTGTEVHGRHQSADRILRMGIASARRRFGQDLCKRRAG